jgi:hypothetical protein
MRVLHSVQVNWFCGDDEVYKLCNTHYPLAKTDDFDQLEALAGR